MSNYYILVNGQPKNVPLMEWAEWTKTNNRKIDKTVIGDVRISTVFLGLDHNFAPEGIPILFETMIFGGKHAEYQERYTSLEEAKAGHKMVVKMVRKDN